MFGGPRVAEPGQSLAYRPPVRPAAASGSIPRRVCYATCDTEVGCVSLLGAAAGGSTALKNIKGADKLL
eukprot:2891143-Rhodomonas_salina.3